MQLTLDRIFRDTLYFQFKYIFTENIGAMTGKVNEWRSNPSQYLTGWDTDARDSRKYKNHLRFSRLDYSLPCKNEKTRSSTSN